MIELRLDSLAVGIPALTPKRAGVHMEACLWCLLKSGHENGVGLEVSEKEKAQSSYSILWPEDEIDVDALNRGYNEDDGPEEGAVAIALLLIRERTEYTALRRAVTKTGIDYWLGHKSFTNGQFLGKDDARLEISGILKQTDTNKPKYRMTQKLKQTRQSDHISFPAYVVIVEFSQPSAEVGYRYV